MRTRKKYYTRPEPRPKNNVYSSNTFNDLLLGEIYNIYGEKVKYIKSKLLSKYDEIISHGITIRGTDFMHKDIIDLNTKFYLIALKSITLAQKTSAGCMIMFYKDLLYT